MYHILAYWQKPFISYLPFADPLEIFCGLPDWKTTDLLSTHISWTVLFLFPTAYACFYLEYIYSWQMQSLSLAKGFQKKSLYHDYPLQLVLILSLERFPAKDYWGLVLARKRKKKTGLFIFFLIKRKTKLEIVKHQRFQGSLSTRRLDIAQDQ